MQDLQKSIRKNAEIHDEHADVLFIYPPLHRLYGERKQWMPLSILYLASYLNEHGICAKAYNADCSLVEPECVMSYSNRFLFARNFLKNLKEDNDLWDEVKGCIRDVRARIIGISVLTEALGPTKKLIELIRNEFDDTVIVAGGPHAEIDPEYLLNELRVDYVMKGDGEKSFYELSSALLAGVSPELRLGDSIRDRVIYAARVDVNELPIPKLESHYRYDLYRKVGRKLNLSTSRGGCVYACKFCYCSKFKYMLRFRAPDSVVEEIAYDVEHYETNKLFFVDDTFTINRGFVESVCKLLIERNLPVSWTCTTRARQVDEKLLVLMKQAGCKSIHIGVESGSQRMLDLVDKKITVDDVLHVSKMIQRAEIECRLFFMAGMPTETSYDLQCSIDLIRRVKPDETILSMYVPIPKTPLYELICEKYYPLDQIDWTTFSRDQVPYHFYVDDADGNYDYMLNRLYQTVEEMNAEKGKR